MDTNEEGRLLAGLSVRERYIVERPPDYSREKILNKLARGFRIMICEHS
ncbi:MAG: hypothetical protein Q7R93_01005 [bacterium]|nr:hypothetical protein [bacterium]